MSLNFNLIIQLIDVPSVQEAFVRHVVTTLARTHFNCDNFAGYQAAAHTVRDQLISKWDETQQHHTQVDQKRVYYLSLEFLMGRTLGNAVLSMGLKGVYAGRSEYLIMLILCNNFRGFAAIGI